MSPHDHERRLTRRTHTSTSVIWTVPRRGKWKTRAVDEAVRVDDVSATGIGIVATTVPGFQRGTKVPIVAHGHAGEIAIRRITPTDNPNETRYGVELLRPTRDLVEELLAQSEIAGRAELEDNWNRAT